MTLDITDAKQAEAALRESEERLRLALEAGNMGTWDWNLRTGELKWSRSLETMYGPTPGSFRRTYEAFLEAVHPEDRDRVREAVLSALEAHSHFEIEFRVRWPDRTVHWVAGKGEVLCDESGRPARMIGLGMDITARKQAEEERERQAQALARSNAELEQFAYIASHDLQEPLRMVASYVQLLARRYRGRLDADADEFIAYAVDGATRMQRLISDLLEFSRVGSRHQPAAACDAERVLGQVLLNLKTSIEESGAVVIHERLPPAAVDPLQLGQLLQNLIGNAVKFRSGEPPRVEIAVRKKGGRWVFSVRDNGIGIDRRHADRIFSIFQRLHRRDDYPGTGIGLAICKKIVEGWGGRIWVESEPGKGATFYFTLPPAEQADRLTADSGQLFSSPETCRSLPPAGSSS